jgi:hypothetical protein
MQLRVILPSPFLFPFLGKHVNHLLQMTKLLDGRGLPNSHQILDKWEVDFFAGLNYWGFGGQLKELLIILNCKVCKCCQPPILFLGSQDAASNRAGDQKKAWAPEPWWQKEERGFGERPFCWKEQKLPQGSISKKKYYFKGKTSQGCLKTNNKECLG